MQRVDAAHPGWMVSEARKEKRRGRSVSICDATPHLSQNHMLTSGRFRVGQFAT